jgi:hypothetical protein
MTSSKQIAANRENAKKSTGPKTEAGKDRSAMNAVTHGLTATRPLVRHESSEYFDSLRDRVSSELQPMGIMEEQLVERIVSKLWRLHRVPAVEAGLFDHQHYDQLAQQARERAELQEIDETVIGEGCWYNPLEPMVWDKEAYDNARVEQKWAEEKRDNITLSLSAAFLGKYGAAFDRVRRYDTSLERSLDKDFERLTRLQAQRRGNAAAGPRLLALGDGGNGSNGNGKVCVAQE